MFTNTMRPGVTPQKLCDFFKMGESPSHHGLFNTKSWSISLHDLGYLTNLGNLQLFLDMFLKVPCEYCYHPLSITFPFRLLACLTGVNERMNEWTNERMNEWRNEGTNERTNEWMNEWTKNERKKEWMNERTNETNEWTNEWMNE